MARITFGGLEEYILVLDKLGKETEKIAKHALYEGVKIVADEVKAGLESLPTQDKRGARHEKLKGIKTDQKKGLIDGFGISTMRNDDGLINVRVGFEGFNSVKTKSYPNGQPNSMIARAVESGTSFMVKTPFLKNAFHRAKSPAEAKMKEVFENEIDEIMKG